MCFLNVKDHNHTIVVSAPITRDFPSHIVVRAFF